MMTDNLHPIYERDYPKAWLRFHADNPDIYYYIRSMALDLFNSGYKTWGMKSLIEAVRWQIATTTTDPVFKINNNHAPYYARYLMDMEPQLEGFFKTREVKANGLTVTNSYFDV
jgi:hypothetical protein|tara:strand:+ start:388 stop:729 length:342 start_codon:yes stop_codon:yes gene_type:complete